MIGSFKGKFEIFQKSIEKDNNVKIIYAVEVGPISYGAKGFSSALEIKFLYVYPLEEYLNIDDTNLKEKIIIKKDDLDISGLELKKALKLLLDFNVPILEWLQSKCIYYEEENIIEELRDYVKNVYSKYKSIQYFSSIAKRYWVSHIKDAKEVDPIYYMIVLKNLLSIDYLIKFNVFPPYHIDDLTLKFQDEKKIFDLIDHKKERIKSADEWIMKKRKEYEKIKINQEFTIDEENFNHLFRKIIKKSI